MDEPRPDPIGPTPGLRRPPWAYTAGGIIIALILIGLAVMIAIPALIIGACVVGIIFIVAAVRATIARLRAGPGEDTLRRNVRVIVRREP